MTDYLYPNVPISEQRAADIIAEHIGQVRTLVSQISALDLIYPNAPVGTAWDTLRDAERTIHAIFHVRDKDAA